MEYQRKALDVWYPERDPLADPALQRGSWGPWKSISADMRQSQNSKEATAPYMDSEIRGNDSFDYVNDSQSLYCCHKYNLTYSSMVSIQNDSDKKVYNLLQNILLPYDNSTNIIDGNNSSRLPATFQSEERDCCHGNITTGYLDTSQVKECCLKSRRMFVDVASIQTAKDKQLYDVLQKVLNIAEGMKRDNIVGNKRSIMRKQQNENFQSHDGKIINKKHYNIYHKRYPKGKKVQ